ncbi:glycosyltransferase family 4 protein [Sphingobacterium corticibacterium]|uniref:Glycosyltransferase family 1 protein n=1 Tax=Sphingobacterium corticibacterium TaxID=2484746 RepID=A0A4Q6XRT6_9SPHI|nr:glycosyltransferase family 1 protein [Sphingobacterium corticibacterium]RZF59439.1 glycosyltransferase family 1 protein [Sphingobacterium corticibacterium]
MEKRQKTIVVEAQRIFRKNKHGMDYVALEVIRSLQTLDQHNTYVIAVGPGEDRCLAETHNFKILVLPSSNYLIWEQVLLPRLVRQTKADLLHCTSNTAPMYCPVPLVLTLHDIIFMEKSMGGNTSLYQRLGRIYRRFVVPVILKSVDRVITVSYFEKENIQQHYAQLKDKLTTVYNGVSPNFMLIEQFETDCLKNIDKGNYWLLLGNTDPKKNIENTLKGYACYLQKSLEKKKLLLVDLTHQHVDRLLNDLDLGSIREFMIVKEYIPHHILAEIYNKAFGFLYPSIRESFGLPIIEAMSCGTPVVTSNRSAMPEIGADQAIYVDPLNPVAIAEGMLSLERDADLYQEKVAGGLKRSKHFTWHATATQTLAIYEDLLAQKNGN